MNISNAPATASAASGLPPPNRVYAPASTSSSNRPNLSHGQKFSETLAAMENAADSEKIPPPDSDDSDWKKKRPDSGGLSAQVAASVTALPAVPVEAAPAPALAPASTIDCGKIAGAVSPGSTTPIAGKATPAENDIVAASISASETNTGIPTDSQNSALQIAPQQTAPQAESDGISLPENTLEAAIVPTDIHSSEADTADPESGIPKGITNTPSGARAIGVDTVSQPGNIANTTAISPPLPTSDMHTLADAFETSVRHFEQSGENWVGRASFTLQSSVLKGASFQLVGDSRSLSIQLTQMAGAAIPISLREETELSNILTRKLGREVNLDLGVSEIQMSEEAELAGNDDE